jgi:hypothetical protein
LEDESGKKPKLDFIKKYVIPLLKYWHVNFL